MKKLYLVANWKSHMLLKQATDWLDDYANYTPSTLSGQSDYEDHKTVVVCPPFTLLQSLQYKIGTFNSQIKVGAQDVSPFEEGAYTGEIAASMLKEFCSYVIVGHSERRKYFGETDEMIANKITQAKKAGLTPILCVQDEKTPIPDDVAIVAYEPIFAIGTGKPDTPANANKVCTAIRKKHPQVTAVLYGGSVDPDNVNTFTSQDSIDGALVGGASLDAETFVNIIKKA